MLAKQRIDIKASADVARREDGADLDRGTAVTGVYLAQVIRCRGIDQRARNGIARYAAAEAVDLAGELFFFTFTQKIDVGEDTAFDLGVLALGADAGEQPAPADADLDLAADLPGQCDRGIDIFGTFLQALQIERDG